MWPGFVPPLAAPQCAGRKCSKTWDDLEQLKGIWEHCYSSIGEYYVTYSDDGRWIIWNDEIMNLRDGHWRVVPPEILSDQTVSEFNWDVVTGPVLVGKTLLWMFDGPPTIMLVDAVAGEALVQQRIDDVESFNLSAVSYGPVRYSSGETDEESTYRLHGDPDSPPRSTPVRRFQFNADAIRQAASQQKDGSLHLDVPVAGEFDQELTAVCRECSQWFPVPLRIAELIERLHRRHGITPDDSPVLKLPDAAWDEPQLFDKCPHCGCKVRFNPFIVDHRKLVERDGGDSKLSQPSTTA